MTLELRPSGAHRWVRCYAYPQFAVTLPVEPPSDAAREGTCAAWVAEGVLLGDAASCEEYYGETHENGWSVDEEMVRHTQGYVDMIKARGGTCNAEEHVVISEASPRLAGTLDNSTDMIIDGLLYVDDLKYGMRIVEVHQNEQVIIYAYGKLMKLHAAGIPIRLIQLSIYQPRAFHPDGIYRKWVITPEELAIEMQRVWNAALECNKPQPLATPGHHCLDCPAATQCVALAQTGYGIVDTVQSHRLRQMTAQELGTELDFLELANTIVKARRKAVTSEAEQRIAKEQIPEWAMKSHTGNRDWKVKDAMSIAIATGKDPYAERKLATPAEMERRHVPESVVNGLTHKQPLGFKLRKTSKKAREAAFNQKEMK